MRPWFWIAKSSAFFLVCVLIRIPGGAVEGPAATADGPDRWVEDRPTWSATPAQVHGYDPFPPNEHPPCWPMSRAVELGPQEKPSLVQEGPDNFGLPARTPIQVMFDFHYSSSSPSIPLDSVRMVKEGKITAGPWQTPDDECQACPQVYFGDLNHDGKLDAFLVIACLGNGLSAFRSRQILILSTSTGGWRAWCKDGFCASDSDLIVVNKQVMVLSSDLASHEAKDGRNHNYWAFDLDAIGDGVITPADQAMTPNFPRWVWYTNKANHAITTAVPRDVQVTQRQKSHWQELPLVKNP